MTKHHSSPIQFNKIIVASLGILFGIVSLVFVYKAVKTSTEQRSKAAQNITAYKVWEFSKSVEDWVGGSLQKLSASDGMLSATIGKKQGNISNKSTIPLPLGNKYIHLRMRVSPKNGTLTPTDRMALRSFIFSLSYWTEGEKTGIPPKTKALILKGIVDGVMRDYYLQIPAVDTITITRIWLGFNSGMILEDQVQFDQISIVNQPSKEPSTTSGVSNSQNRNTNNSNRNPQATPNLPSGTPGVPPGFYRVAP